MKLARAFGFVVFAVLLTAVVIVPAVRAERTTPADYSGRDARTAAEQKIDVTLLSEIHRRRGDVRPAAALASNTSVRIDRHGRALVDVRAPVGPELQKKVRALGGLVVRTTRTYDSIVSWVPLLTLERLAADPNVRAIEPAR
jgi:hypothetical protein